MKLYQRIVDYVLIPAYSIVVVLWYDTIVDRLYALHRRLTRSEA